MRIALALLVLLLAPAGAHAASVAYVDNGEVWLSSLDGAQKVRLAAPVVNGEGKTEKWLAVAQADNGRIVAARNEPGMSARLSWFKVWEPNGTSTVEGPLNAPSGWALYVYPLSFDVTADGKHMVYGYSNSGFCCPIQFARGTYVRPVTDSVLDPVTLSGREYPTVFGSRVVARDGTIVSAQEASSTYSPNFDGWLDVGAAGLDVRRTDLAANGQLAALEFERFQGPTQTDGRIALISANGVGPLPDPLPVDCFLPAAGFASEASLSQDARAIAWVDDGGVKVAGAPTSAADPCVLSPAPVVLSATGESPSIGGANVAAFLPPPPPVTTPETSTPATTTPNSTPSTTSTTTTRPPSVALPQLQATLAYNFVAGRNGTRFLSLAVRNIAKGATVTVRCPKGCARRTYTKRNASGSLSLKSLVKKPLKVGASLTVTVSKAGSRSVTKQLKVRARKAPLVTTRLG